MEREVTVYDNAQLEFQWKIASGSGKQLMVEVVDAKDRNRIVAQTNTTNTNWNKCTIDLSGNPSGATYLIRWIYVNERATADSDTAWVDDVKVTSPPAG